MEVHSIYLKNFRCFEQSTFSFDNRIVLIEGQNGSGKTSLLEALHYACYVRSFRTAYPVHLTRFEQDSFFLKIGFSREENRHSLHIGFSDKKKVIKLDQKSVTTHKHIIDHYRTVAITEEDIHIIRGNPDIRRRFLDSFIILQNPDYIVWLKNLKTITDNRNSLLRKMFSKRIVNDPSYMIWTEQLREVSGMIRGYRIEAMNTLISTCNKLLASYIGSHITLTAIYKKKEYSDIIGQQEKVSGRSHFGAHLEDFSIEFQQKQARVFASRGQQKLVTVLLKVAQIEQLRLLKGGSILLIDDFMTDFDKKITVSLLEILCAANVQMVFTSPLEESLFKKELLLLRPQQIILTS